MAQDPLPGPGRDGEPPRVSGAAERAAAPWLPPDYPDALVDEFTDAVGTGREQFTEAADGWSGVTVSLGDAADVDMLTLATMTGPDGLAGLGFHQDKMADAMRPGPLLDALTTQAVVRAPSLSDNELFGAISAAGRLRAYAEWLELSGIAEFARRRDAQYEASVARGDKPRHRDGEYPAEELGYEMLITHWAAGRRMDMATDLATRLPLTFAGLRAGTISGDKAHTIQRFTAYLPEEKAAEADRILAAAAPDCSPNALYARARRVCYRLDPEAFDREKDEAARTRRRVEVRQEDSGNAQVSVREMPVEEAAAVKAEVYAEAARLRNAGLDLPLREIRYLVMIDRALGRDPWERVAPASARSSDPDGREEDATVTDDPVAEDFDDTDRDDDGDDDRPVDDRDDEPDEGRPGGRPGSAAAGKAPVPALINLIVPAGTLLGWSDVLGEAGGWGLLDPEQTRGFTEAASRHPRSRWCVTVTGPDGEAIAHGCSRGHHRWSPPDGGNAARASARDAAARAGPDERQQAQLIELLRQLDVKPERIAKGSCDHSHREDRYTPSRKLKHLLRARTNTCCAPGCGAQAITGEIDHTLAYPEGATDECNLSPPCIRHHKVKHAPSWKLEQPEPGVMRWTAPSGRAYTTRPTVYD